MEQQKKVDCWRKMYAFLEPFEEIVDLHKPEQAKELELECKIGGARVNYQLRLNNDLLMIRAEIPCPDKSNDDIMDFGNKIVEDVEGDVSAYPVNGTLTILCRTVFTGLTEEKAEELVDKTGEDFFKYLIDNEEVIMNYTKEKPRKMKKEEKKAAPERMVTPKKESGPSNNAVNTVSKALEKKPPVPEKSPKKENVKPPVTSKASEIRAKVRTEANPGRPSVNPSVDESTLKKIAQFEEERKKFEKNKADFLQYKKDQKILADKKEKDITELKNRIESEQKILAESKAKFEEEKKKLEEELKAVNTEKARLETLSMSLTEDRKVFEVERDNWNKTTPDERILARREELSLLENSFCEKEEAFQKFRSDALKEIELRMSEADKRESDVSANIEELRKRENELNKRISDADLRDTELREKEAILINKEAELSDKEAELKRSAIIKVDAENMQKQLKITEKTIEKEKERLRQEQEALQIKQNDFLEKYERVMKSIDNMDKKEAEIKEKEIQISNMIQQYEAMKNDPEQTKNKELSEANKNLTAAIAGKDNTINQLRETINKNKEANHELTKEKDVLEGDNKRLSSKLSEIAKEKESLELEIAEIRGELFEAREQINSSSNVNTEPDVVVREVPVSSEEDKEKIRALEDEIKDLRTNLNVVLDENESLMASNSGQIDQSVLNDKDSEIEALRRRLMTMEQDMSDKDTEIENLKKNRTEIVPMNDDDEPVETVESLLEDLKENGFNFKEEMSETMGLYVAEKDGCKIHYNVEYDMIQVEKKLAKKFRNISELNRLNNKDMSMSFILDNKGKESTLICRKTIKADPVADIRSVMVEFSNFA